MSMRCSAPVAARVAAPVMILVGILLAGCTSSLGSGATSEPLEAASTRSTASPAAGTGTASQAPPATTPALAASPTPEPSPTPPTDPGAVTASFDGEELDMAGAIVECDVSGDRVGIIIRGAAAPGDYWTTLWSTENGVDVLDLGIGYGVPLSVQHGVRYWSNRIPRTEMTATKSGLTYEIRGETYDIMTDDAGENVVTWPIHMAITCPADSH